MERIFLENFPFINEGNIEYFDVKKSQIQVLYYDS
jgi:hypothetical protein